MGTNCSVTLPGALQRETAFDGVDVTGCHGTIELASGDCIATAVELESRIPVSEFARGLLLLRDERWRGGRALVAHEVGGVVVEQTITLALGQSWVTRHAGTNDQQRSR